MIIDSKTEQGRWMMTAFLKKMEVYERSVGSRYLDEWRRGKADRQLVAMFERGERCHECGCYMKPQKATSEHQFKCPRCIMEIANSF